MDRYTQGPVMDNGFILTVPKSTMLHRIKLCSTVEILHGVAGSTIVFLSLPKYTCDTRLVPFKRTYKSFDSQ